MDSPEAALVTQPVPPEAGKPAQGEVSRWRRPDLLRWAIGIGITLIVLFLATQAGDLAQVGRATTVLLSRPELLAAFVASYAAAFLLRSVAWTWLLPSLGVVRSFSILHTALFANHVLPVKVGEVLRPALAMRRDAGFAEAATSTILARWLDYASVLLIAAVLLPLAANPWTDKAAFLLPLLIVGIAGGGLLWVRSGEAFGFLPSALAQRVDTLSLALRRVSPQRFIAAALLTFPSWLMEAGVVLVASTAMGVGLPLHAALGVTAFTILFQVVHFTPGGIGIYEASMTAGLMAFGVPGNQALAVALLTHGMKFAYSCSIGMGFAAWEGRSALHRGNRSPEAVSRGTRTQVRKAGRFEIAMARLWNVVNEGKPFTPVFTLAVIAVISLPSALNVTYWVDAGLALLVLAPLFLVFYQFDFPLKLRIALWVYLAAFLAFSHFWDPVAVGVTLTLYLGFTVVLWGTVYYHLRIGTPWTNFTRFWRLVLENPDPTSGNFLEQVPKVLLLVLAFQFLVGDLSLGAIGTVWGLVALVGVSAVLLHQWAFTWVPPTSQAPTRLRNPEGRGTSRRFIVIAIDGCRADRLLEANTPFIDRLRSEGADFPDCRTVYPARTVTCFSSMLTGASPGVHGMHSNFVPSLGVKCDSIFGSLRRNGMEGKLVGIAHLVDAFGEKDVRTVSAVMHNDEIDHALSATAKRVLVEEDPDLLVLQMLSVDQTGHSRGSYNREYLAKIEETDCIIQEFVEWCRGSGYLDEATVLITSDHGQGIGIGGHGHMSRSEIYVPCVVWGAGVAAGQVNTKPRSVMDVAPTIAYYLGAQPPAQSTGQVLLGPKDPDSPVAVIIPAYNEADNLPTVLSRIPRDEIGNVMVIVVDDGSTDNTSQVAREGGAEVVVRHDRNRGLGAALRTGLERAREMNAHAAVYLDADCEYDPREMSSLLAPIESGEADYVLGSRYRGDRDGQPISRLVANLFFTGMLCMASGRFITDGQTGFRAFSRRALDVAEIVHDYNYAQVLTLDLLKKGMRLVEVPITYHFRKRGTSFISLRYLWKVPLGMMREMLAD